MLSYDLSQLSFVDDMEFNDTKFSLIDGQDILLENGFSSLVNGVKKQEAANSMESLF